MSLSVRSSSGNAPLSLKKDAKISPQRIWSNSFSTKSMAIRFGDSFDVRSKNELEEPSYLSFSFENEQQHDLSFPIISYAKFTQLGEITAKMRDVTVKTILTLVRMFHLERQTFFLAVTYLD
eukprot:Sdes_comp21131_c0_seq1m19806